MLGPPLTVRARTYSQAGDPLSTCDDTINTRLVLHNTAGTDIETSFDIDGSDNRCSAIDGRRSGTDPAARLLQPGLYYLRVAHDSVSPGTGTTGTYFLEIILEP